MQKSLLLWLIMLYSFYAAAQVSLTTSPYNQDFNTLATSGTSSTLPAGWLFSEAGTSANATYTAGTGSANTGDTYSFGATSSTERAFGGLQSGTLIPTIGCGFTNNTGSAITSITITYNGEQWRLGATARTDRLDFQYSTDATSLTTGTWTDVDALDFTAPVTSGTTGALNGNTSPNRTDNISSTITVNIPSGATFFIRLQDFNASGADDGLGIDDFQLAFNTAGGGSPSLFIASFVNPSEPATNGNFVVSLSSTQPGDINFTYSIGGTATAGADYTALSGNGTITAGNTTTTIPVNIIDDAINESGETIIITLQAGAGYTLGTPAAVTLTLGDDDLPVTNIGTIQGTGAAATPGTFAIEAVVTGIYPLWSPAGFYVQEEDADADGDPLTSNGIYVASSTAVSVGDRVRIIGTVQENGSTPSFNQAVIIPTLVTVLSSGNPLPSVTDINLPVTATTDLERYEGMIIRFPYALTVSGNRDLGRFGELRLARNGLVYQPTQVVDPNDNPASGTNSSGNTNVPAVTAYATNNALRTIILDDGANGIPAALPYIDANSTVRLGSTTTNLTGVLGFGFSAYRVMPFGASHPLGSPAFSYAARPTTPPSVGGAPNLKVVGFNVENFFNGDGAGGGFPTTRGADSFAEYQRQLDKIVEALYALNADIVGLVEIENDGVGANSAIAQLVSALNTRFGVPGLYAFINDAAQPPFPTGDEIRSTIIYKTTVVTTVGLPMIDLAPVHNRAPTAQTFNLTAVNKTFTVMVNHLRAKACSGSSTGANADQNDGQGCNNDFRKQQANAIINFINTTVIPTSGNDRIIAVGDYNAYHEEDPIDIFRANNFVVLGNNNEPSYLFAGQLGTLDHVIITNSLLSTVTGVAKWTINSHEPAYFGYDDNIQDPTEPASEVNPWYTLGTGIPFGTSDHDPVLAGFIFSSTLPVQWGNFTVSKAGSAVKINWSTLQEVNSRHFVIERSADTRNWNSITTIAAAGNSTAEIKYSYVDLSPLKAKNYYRIRQVDENGTAKTTDIRTISFTDFKTISFFPNPTVDRITLQSGTTAIISYRIIDGEGRTLIQSNVNQLSTSIDISKLKPGIYTLQVVTNEGTTIEKLIKQ